MKNFYIKFNHGVEIGARNAYIGHYKRTQDKKILSIATDELRHQMTLALILKRMDDEPSPVIDSIFYGIGRSIAFLCKIFPERSLNFVAACMEVFAIYSYGKLADDYPEYRKHFQKMAETELEHQKYFRGKD